MTLALKRLVELGGEPLGEGAVELRSLVAAIGEEATVALWPLLQLKNGFLAFEGALHVLPASGATERTIAEWNDYDLWRREFEGMADDAVFFAEDVFGVQFAVRDGAIATFDPETGTFEDMAENLDEWARAVLDDYENLTGCPVIHEWQRVQGQVPRGCRLVPTIPFVLGGEIAAQNLRVIDAAEGMRFRASIAVQIRDLPDGAKVDVFVGE